MDRSQSVVWIDERREDGRGAMGSLGLT